MAEHDRLESRNGLEVAVVGLSGRFPGAPSVEALWRNLRDGVESISFFDADELAAAGVPTALLANPAYVRARGTISNLELFDAEFFGFSPREAEILDPQQRLFLECCWEALEQAACDPERYGGWVGVFAGVGTSSYYLRHLSPSPDLLEAVGRFQVSLGNDKDFLAPRVSYKLNLKGPSLTVQTACSTSLVAIHLACQSLLRGECDMALAGGVSIGLPQVGGYLYQPGGILSPDGHCRAFDASGHGCVGGSGVGVVALKRLEDALADGDFIHAVIKGSAVNNDGAAKLGFTAPQIDGQAKVIHSAHLMAEVEPETISYVEAHGTATELGDPIEVAGLTQAFRMATAKEGFCALGSVKTNVGHLDAAAGVTGFIKTVLALAHRQLPPSLHFERANPEIDFARTPFYVNTHLTPWTAQGPLRAGVSSFGIGGTNAHVVVEEAPPREESGASRSWQVLVLSAKSPEALARVGANLAEHLVAHPDLALADVAHTLQVGRAELPYRQALVCRDAGDAVAALADPVDQSTVGRETRRRSVAFLFPGQGAQHVRMAAGLYETEERFRREVDACAGLLRPLLGLDLRQVIDPATERTADASGQLRQTALAQPALFVVEYALAQLWMSWGIRPAAMLGHSLGEYTAACLAGVFSLETALRLVAVRGRLMQARPGGSMLAVSLPAEELASLLDSRLSLAAVNGPSLSVAAGPDDAILALRSRLEEGGVGCRPLHTSHAFHSAAMEPVVAAFTTEVAKVDLRPPRLPFLSNVTGDWITAEEATSPAYWGRQLRDTVRFGDGLRRLLRDARVLLEVGPGSTLTALTSRHPDRDASVPAIASCRHPRDADPDDARLLAALGQLWAAGVEVDWPAFAADERRRRVPLPTYPFARRRYWIEPQAPGPGKAAKPMTARQPDLADWFYRPAWAQSPAPGAVMTAKARDPRRLRWLLLLDSGGLGAELAGRLRERGDRVVTAVTGEELLHLEADAYSVNPHDREAHRSLLAAAEARLGSVDRVVCLWAVDDAGSDGGQALFFSLLALAQGIGDWLLGRGMAPQGGVPALHLAVISTGLQNVTGDEALIPGKAVLLGPIRVMPQEYPGVSCASVDVVSSGSAGARVRLLRQLVGELESTPTDPVVAYRGAHRFVQTFEPLRLDDAGPARQRLRERGTYVITGGLGGIGLAVAELLARSCRARLLLISRRGLPPRSEWERWAAGQEEWPGAVIRRVQQIERLGAEVLVRGVDVADRRQIGAAIEEVRRQFGPIHGVIHAAGLPGGGVMQLQTTTAATAVLRPKVEGTLALAAALAATDLDFVLLFSSQRALLGGSGRVEYCAANAFLDAFAQARSAGGEGIFQAIDWDGWSEVGMAAREMERGDEKDPGCEALLSTAEGLEALLRVLATRLPQVVVSTGDFAARIAAARAATAEVALVRAEDVRRHQPRVHPRPRLAVEYAAPASPVERALAEIWSTLLGIEPVGIHDDFLELGGDSVVGLQMVAKASQAGIALTARQVLEHPTIAELAAVAGTGAGRGAEQGEVVGEVPLTPIQHWFFARGLGAPHHFNQASVLGLDPEIDRATLEKAVAELLKHHDALRLRFTREGSGWRQVNAPPEAAAPFSRIGLEAIPAVARSSAVTAVAAQSQTALDLARGPLVRVVLCELGEGRAPRLIVVIHHLAIDVISWRILFEDLERAVGRLATGATAGLPAKTTSFKRWAERLADHARSQELGKEVSYWLDQPWERVASLPRDFDRGPNQVRSAGVVTVTLSAGESRRLLQEVPQVYRARVHELLLTALAETVTRWTGGTALAIAMEGHGREPLFVGLDLSRTVGWFTCMFPLLLDLGSGADLGEHLKRTKEILLRVPHGGLGHGLLSYMSDSQDVQERLRRLPSPELVFLYTGQVDDRGAGGRLLGPADEGSGASQDTGAPRSHLLEVTAGMAGECLELIWTYSRNHHRRETIEGLARSCLAALCALVDHCLSSSEVEYTPAEFPEAALDQQELDELVAEVARAMGEET
jgi:non-ribosomal peptide synthase protein (TIGR01720 family)